MPGPGMSVVDVYELATDIGSEFERMIDAFGTDAVTKLMPKVINALELLESYAQENGNENDDGDQIVHLKSKIAHLESEKIEKAEDRHKFEKELELMEENLQEENKNLLQLIRRLKEENRRLGNALAEKDEPQCNHEQDLKLMQKMTILVNRQKEQLRQQELSSNQKNAEFDSLQGQMEELKRQNRELLKMQQSTRIQVMSLVEEKEQLQMRCQDQEEELSSLQENLGVVCKTNEDLTKASAVPTCSNTVTYDVDDPERPRFTVRELRKILFERNDLKARVSELEDELEMYRPKSRTNSSKPPERSLSPAAEDEGPVQGPINKEPDDAPWKKRDSGIRKLYVVEKLSLNFCTNCMMGKLERDLHCPKAIKVEIACCCPPPVFESCLEILRDTTEQSIPEEEPRWCTTTEGLFIDDPHLSAAHRHQTTMDSAVMPDIAPVWNYPTLHFGE